MIGVRDSVGNNTMLTITPKGEGGASSSGSGLITSVTIAEGVIYGSDKYLTSDGVLHDYADSDHGYAGIMVPITASPITSGDYLSGYAELFGIKYSLTWGGFDSMEKNNGGTETTAFAKIPAGSFTRSALNTSIRIYVNEYSDAALTTRVNSDKTALTVSIDVAAPTVSMTYNKYSGLFSIEVTDPVSGVKSAAVEKSIDGGEYADLAEITGIYTVSVTDPDTVFRVTAEDLLGNTSLNTSISLSPTDGSGNGDIGLGKGVFTYKTYLFYCYLIGAD